MQIASLAMAGLAAVLLLAACGKKEKEPYPASIRQMTYNACVAGFKDKARGIQDVDATAAIYCNCVMDGFQESVPLKDFIEYDRMLATAERGTEFERISGLVNGVADMCLKQHVMKQGLFP